MDQLSPQLMHKLVFTVLMHGLNENQTPIAHKVLLEALNHPNPQVRELAVVALADLPVGAVKRVAALSQALVDPVGRVRRRAARSLGDQGPASIDALPQLIQGLRDVDPSVRRDCAGACGRLGPAAAAAASRLVGLLSEPETRTRAVMAVALKRVGLAAVPALLEGLRSPDPELRGRCTTLLQSIAPADPRVVEAMAATTTHEPVELRARSDSAMQHVTTPPPVAIPRHRTALNLNDEADAITGVLLTD